MYRFNKILSCVFVFALAMFMIMGYQVAHSQSYDVDQTNDAHSPGGGYVFPGWDPIGQQFVPSYSSLDVVELYLNSQIGAVGTAFVRIREATITGPILGTSSLFEVPPYATPLTLSRFDFVTPVLLTPGSTHVIEVVAASGRLAVFITGWNNNSYPDGAAIRMGELCPDVDLWFREGISGTVPTETTTWGQIKALYLN